MAIGVDTSKWKPRNLRGTPAAKFRNLLAYGVVGAGMLFGVIFHFADTTKGLRQASESLYEDPIEEVERRQLIAGGLASRSGDHIRKLLKEQSRPDLPYK